MAVDLLLHYHRISSRNAKELAKMKAAESKNVPSDKKPKESAKAKKPAAEVPSETKTKGGQKPDTVEVPSDKKAKESGKKPAAEVPFETETKGGQKLAAEAPYPIVLGVQVW
eukprot:s4175_g2.t1